MLAIRYGITESEANKLQRDIKSIGEKGLNETITIPILREMFERRTLRQEELQQEDVRYTF